MDLGHQISPLHTFTSKFQNEAKNGLELKPNGPTTLEQIFFFDIKLKKHDI